LTNFTETYRNLISTYLQGENRPGSTKRRYWKDGEIIERAWDSEPDEEVEIIREKILSALAGNQRRPGGLRRLGTDGSNTKRDAPSKNSRGHGRAVALTAVTRRRGGWDALLPKKKLITESQRNSAKRLHSQK